MKSKTTIEFLAHLKSLNIKLWADGNHLRYNAPSGILTAELLNELLERKPEILTLLNEIIQTAYASPPPIAITTRPKHIPLSYSQQRLWLLDQFEPGNIAYNIPIAVRLFGPMDIDALRKSLNEMVARHEVLRTTFATVEGQPIQVIVPRLDIPLTILELKQVNGNEILKDYQRALSEAAWQPFDLRLGPLIRVHLIRLDEAEFVLLITMHHIISDGWSISLIAREISELYNAYISGKPSSLPPLNIQYADYTLWQRQWLSGRALDDLLVFWQNRLDGVATTLELPTDQIYPPNRTYHGSTERFELDINLTQKLETLSQNEGATLFMTLLAIFITLLARYSGQQDFLVGTPIANRQYKGTESLIGFFVNSLILRTNVSDNPSFIELLHRIRETALEAYDHQDAPFEKLVEIINPERNLSKTPLFQVTFSLQNIPEQMWNMAYLTAEPIEIENPTSKFDLSLSFATIGNILIGEFAYNTDLFDQDSIKRMAGHFKRLVIECISDPQAHISDLMLLTLHETHQMIIEWNNTHVPFPDGNLLHQLFEDQVKRTPQAIAVIAGDQEITYLALNEQANQLANFLISLGVKTETLVGICMERSLHMVIGLLGILKAGAAYIPMDPNYPKDRLDFMLHDAQPIVLLTQHKMADQLPKHTGQTIYLDIEWAKIAEYPIENPSPPVHPHNPAYVIYTSGSTGTPKGAVLTHQSICNHMHWFLNEFPMDDSDAVLQKTPFSFDASVWEFYAPLLTGAKLVMAAPNSHVASVSLIDEIQKYKITIIQCVPTLLQMLLQDPKFHNCTYLRQVFSGGEALPTAYVEQFYNTLPEAKLCNLYGPTEVTIDSLFWCCENLDKFRNIPIGRPISNVQAYILDRNYHPVPIGVPGELILGGLGLGRGYHKRPGMTAERFVPNPFCKEPGERLFRTGDRARYRSDGTIEFLGRLDFQIKLRGYRIELGEIEKALERHPAVKEAVVIVHQSTPEDQRLVGYFTKNLESPTVDELRRFLSEKLPDYMVPNFFITLDAMPLSPSGKINRRALPAPVPTRSEYVKTYHSPRNSTEQALANIWADILKLDRVGIYDDFFDFGGHSLLATQLLYRIKEEFQVALPIKILFQKPTIAGLSEFIQVRDLEKAPNLLPISDITSDIILAPDIHAKSKASATNNNPQTIFLTGATGFLGAYLLRFLLEQTQALIYCLVRSSGVNNARSRIEENLSSYLLKAPDTDVRIIPVRGDLSKPYLALPIKEFSELASNLDVIYHCGAEVNFIYPYKRLRHTNVLGTQEILRLASISDTIPVHYISTTSVFDSPEYFGSQSIQEEDVPEHISGIPGGYAQSKWAAEKLAIAARTRGLPITIYRPGIISGDSKTGAWNTNDFICRLIKGFIQLGCMPNQDTYWRLAPVDFVSQAIIQLSLQPSVHAKTYHIVSPHLLNSKALANQILDFGYNLRFVTPSQWTEELEKVEQQPHSALYPLLPLLREKYESENEIHFDDKNLSEVLSTTNLQCPPIDNNVLKAYLTYFDIIGYLDSPNQE